MTADERIEQMSLEDFIDLYEQEGAFEFINGERIPLMPPVVLHGWLIRALFRLMDAHCLMNKAGEVFTELPYVLLYDSNWVTGARVPDILFFSASRWRQYVAEVTDWQKKPFIIVPDLVVEVISPNDLYTDIQDKVDRYLADGVPLIWVFNPRNNRTAVYYDGQYISLTEDETLTGGEVLPGFTVVLKTIFTDLV